MRSTLIAYLTRRRVRGHEWGVHHRCVRTPIGRSAAWRWSPGRLVVAKGCGAVRAMVADLAYSSRVSREWNGAGEESECCRMSPLLAVPSVPGATMKPLCGSGMEAVAGGITNGAGGRRVDRDRRRHRVHDEGPVVAQSPTSRTSGGHQQTHSTTLGSRMRRHPAEWTVAGRGRGILVMPLYFLVGSRTSSPSESTSVPPPWRPFYAEVGAGTRQPTYQLPHQLLDRGSSTGACVRRQGGRLLRPPR